MGILCKKGDFLYMYMGFRDPGCFHPVPLPSCRILETSALSQNGKEMVEKERLLLRIKALLQKGQSSLGLTFHSWELHMGVPPKCKGWELYCP